MHSRIFLYQIVVCTSRTLLAAMHHNENADRMQAVTIDGRLRYKVCYPKYKSGQHSVKVVKTEPTHGLYILRIVKYVLF